MAEYRGMCQETIPALVEFMRPTTTCSATGRSRVVHTGKRAENEFPMRASLLGRARIEALYRAAFEPALRLHPQWRCGLTWHGRSLLYDDPQAIVVWAATVMEDAAGALGGDPLSYRRSKPSPRKFGRPCSRSSGQGTPP